MGCPPLFLETPILIHPMEKKHMKRRLNTPKTIQNPQFPRFIQDPTNTRPTNVVVMLFNRHKKIPTDGISPLFIEHLWKIPLKLQERILESQTIRECEHTWTLYEIIIPDIYPLIPMVVSKHASLSETLCLSLLPSRLCTVLPMIFQCCEVHAPLKHHKQQVDTSIIWSPIPSHVEKTPPPLPKKGDTMQFLFLCTQKIQRFFFLGPSQNRILKGEGWWFP